MAATSLAPPPNYSTLKHFLPQKPPRINLKLAENFNPQRISSSPTSISWSKAGQRSRKSSRITVHAYVSGAFDAIVSANEPRIEESEVLELRPIDVISWGLLFSLVLRHKWRVLASVITLLGGTVCMLAMPVYSGRFFEVLIGARQESIWKVLSRVGILYIVEPICTVIFVINMSSIWEKVLTSLRAQIFQRVLIQKVEFFDRYKVHMHDSSTSRFFHSSSYSIGDSSDLIQNMFTKKNATF